MVSIIKGNGRPKQAQPEPIKQESDLSPHNAEAEAAVLGCILINQNGLYGLKRWFEPRFFFLVKHAWIYEAMLALEARHENIDLITVTDELKVRNQVDQIGGAAYILQLTNDTPTHIHLGTYARIVKECWKRRELVALASRLAHSAITFSPD